jgi:hypothetical protein
MASARYEQVRIDNLVRDCAVLIALGIDDKGIISMDDFSKNLLNSIKSKRPHYSEIFSTKL